MGECKDCQHYSKLPEKELNANIEIQGACTCRELPGRLLVSVDTSCPAFAARKGKKPSILRGRGSMFSVDVSAKVQASVLIRAGSPQQATDAVWELIEAYNRGLPPGIALRKTLVCNVRSAAVHDGVEVRRRRGRRGPPATLLQDINVHETITSYDTEIRPRPIEEEQPSCDPEPAAAQVDEAQHEPVPPDGLLVTWETERALFDRMNAMRPEGG